MHSDGSVPLSYHLWMTLFLKRIHLNLTELLAEVNDVHYMVVSVSECRQVTPHATQFESLKLVKNKFIMENLENINQ